MRFLVLGPLEVTDGGGEPIPIAGSKERTVLADLIARAGRVVSVDDLIEDLWGEQPPRTAEKTLGSYVSRLRRALEPTRAAGSTSDVIVTRGNGYTLEVAADEVDSLRFEELAERGRQLLDSGRPEDAGSALDEALGLWRGSAYQEYRYTGFGTSEGERLEELRRSAEEDRVDTRIAAGDASSLIADLEAMVRAEPLRERRWGQLMLALYRAGRQAEALHAFTRARSVLVDELGIEPGPDLSRLQTAILAQDPALEEPWSGSRTQAVSSTDVCPYKGLARFETSDAAFYFGREQVVSDAVGSLIGGRFLALVGASGSGKSSILRAGLLHALESGAIPGSDRWSYALIRPGDHPISALASALSAPAPHEPADPWSATRRVLVVDQFEETFTACADEAERTAFLDAITDAALHPEGEVTIVLAMRADYYGRCAEHDALASLVAGNQILVGSMKTEELRRAIELPAERVGLRVEDRLTDALIEHTVNQPGGLPLLSTALLELWTRRRDKTLHLDDYLGSGGVEGAVARMAERAFGGLDSNEQVAAKRILVRLAASGDGSEVVGRAAPLSEFDLDRDADASRAMAALTEARLITIDEGTVEVAHEALLRDWPRLRGWLEDDAEGRRLHRHVTESTKAWDEGGRDDGDLYRGARLTAALDWADAHDPDLNTAEREYLAKGRSASEGEVARVRRTNRRIRGLLSGVAVLLVLSLVVGNLALRQRDDARAAADVADARRLAAASLTERDSTISLLLAREAVALDDSPTSRDALLSSLQRVPTAIAEMHSYGSTPGDRTRWLTLSPDGRIVAIGGAQTTVDLFDAATYKPLGQVDVGAGTTTGDFSSDGNTIAVADVDHQVVGIDVRALEVSSRVTTEGNAVDTLVFTPQAGPLITAESKREKGFLVQRDPITLEPLGAPVRSSNGPIVAMDVSADGRSLVTSGFPPDLHGLGARTDLWKASELEQVKTYGVGGNDIAISPDGRTAAIAAADRSDHFVGDLEGHLVLLDLRTGRPRTSQVNGSPRSTLTGVAFSRDGRSVISTGDDHRVLIWDASSLTIRERFDDPARLSVFTPVLSPDDATAFTVDADGDGVAWDLSISDRSLGRSFIAGSGALWSSGYPWFAISPDAATLAINQTTRGGNTGFVRFVDSSTLERIADTPDRRYGGSFPGFPGGLAFSPDGKTLAVSANGGYVQLWDPQTGAPDGPPFAAPVPGADAIAFWFAAFSPDGSTLATAGVIQDPLPRKNRGFVFLWDVATRRFLGQLPLHKYPVSFADFTPDGRRIVLGTGFEDGAGDVIVWNIGESRVEERISADDSGLWWGDISDDGAMLVTGGESSGERLWDLATGQPIGPAFASDIPNTVDLSADGQTLVTAGGGWVTMRDVATGTILGRSWFPDPIAKENNLAAAFSPDGGRLFVVSDSGQAWAWNVDPALWASRACQIAGRSLTEAEWSVNLPDRPYEPICSS
jgi:DNA-binding SARP family transcriptional activator/WD40 repeat protein